MTALLTHLLPRVSLALVVSVQAVVSSASCCLLKEAIAGGVSCGHSADAAVTRSCCQQEKVFQESAPPERVPSPTGCPVCLAEAKVAAGDRVAVPLPDVSGSCTFTLRDVRVLPSASGEVSAADEIDEPVPRTSLASCALLCVWLI